MTQELKPGLYWSRFRGMGDLEPTLHYVSRSDDTYLVWRQLFLDCLGDLNLTLQWKDKNRHILLAQFDLVIGPYRYKTMIEISWSILWPPGARSRIGARFVAESAAKDIVKAIISSKLPLPKG